MAPDIPLRQKMVALADAYAEAKGVSRSHISTIVFSAGHVLDRIANQGRDITTGTFERGVRWFSDNWPDDTPWPEGIARPSAHLAVQSDVQSNAKVEAA